MTLHTLFCQQWTIREPHQWTPFYLPGAQQNGRYCVNIVKYNLRKKVFCILIHILPKCYQLSSLVHVSHWSGQAASHYLSRWWPSSLMHASPGLNELTHWGRNKMADISQTTFSNAFSWMKIHQFLQKFHWSLFLRVELTIFQHRFR